MTTDNRIPMAVAMPELKLNRTERAYLDTLNQKKAAGEIRLIHIQSQTFLLGYDCRYTPDFIVITSDGRVEAHEVKGFRREDAMVKIRVAATAYPWITFILCEREKGQWVTTEIKAANAA